MDTDTTVSGDDYFSDAPESNGDVTSPVGDIDSYSDQDVTASESVEEVEGDDYPSDELEASEDSAALVSEDAEPDSEWLPGFEGRFKPGDEAKALASYQELEKAYSKKDQEFREQLAAEREAAFRQAKELLTQEKAAPSWQELEQQRGQLMGLAMQDPDQALEYAIQTGDEKNINAVINIVANGDPSLGLDGNPAHALAMQRVVAESQTRIALEEQRAEIAAIRQQGYANEAKIAFQSEYAEALQIPELQAEFNQVASDSYAAGRFDASSPQAIKGFLEECLTKAYGKLAMKGQLPAAQQAAPAQQVVDPHAGKRAARLEGGSPTRSNRPAEPKTDFADAYGDDLVAAARGPRPY